MFRIQSADSVAHPNQNSHTRRCAV